MAIYRVHSSDSQVFVSGSTAGQSPQRLAMIQSLDVSSQKNFTELQRLGDHHYCERILNSNQETSIGMDVILSTGISGVDPFYSFQEQESGFLSTGSYGFRLSDNAGESLVSGAYLTSYELRGSVDGLVEGSIGYIADSITFSSDNALTQSDASSDGGAYLSGVFQPASIRVSASGQDFFNNPIPMNEGIETKTSDTEGVYIQNFSVSVDVARQPVSRIGERTPKFRYPQLPANGSVSFSVIKNQVTGLDLNSLVLETGNIKIDLQNDNNETIMSFPTSGCSLVSISESKQLDSNATLDFSYTFSITK